MARKEGGAAGRSRKSECATVHMKMYKYVRPGDNWVREGRKREREREGGTERERKKERKREREGRWRSKGWRGDFLTEVNCPVCSWLCAT